MLFSQSTMPTEGKSASLVYGRSAALIWFSCPVPTVNKCDAQADELNVDFSKLCSGTLDRNEFVRMMYEFIQSREPPSDEEGEGQEGEGETPLTGPEVDGTYPPSDGVVAVSIMSCHNLLAADSNGVSDPYVKLKMGATGNERKTKVLAKTLNPVFAQTFQLKLRRLPRRVGDQILRCVADPLALTSPDLLPEMRTSNGTHHTVLYTGW